ncbi:dihydrolipoyl dehydrogenase [Candidatus Planktophila versatilis]|uniref:Dihydrolipoyl dehydrogenase n=1 Tax=Candidatus Planktophila versatilis TaxID=1884905 RepID=A0ABM6MEK7_9ACTN|nr:dihydrolipoyl dehydrogenase [Candidatus Planktophila versatilis]ASY17339.1 dihydrolipoamide dehydrogenase [Candidatus Planktophila versatilis]
MSNFDLVVLGGGSGGYAAALRGAQLGLSVALIEKDKVGGTCLHRGCIPTKALLHAGEVADSARESSQFGVNATFNSIDMGGVNSYKDGVIAGLYKGLQGLVKSRGITYVEGTGRLVSNNTVDVNGTQYVGKNIVLATGSYARTLPGLDIDGKQVITSDHGTAMDYVPKSVIVLGGGVIGCEFASVWKSFGSEVTIIEGLPHLVALEDESSSKLLERAFRKRGINFELGTRFKSHRVDSKGVTVTLEDGREFTADVLLVSVGRGPVTDGIGYKEVGIAMDRGYITVDDHCRTNIPGIFAVGDIIPTLQLAHVGFQEGILVAETIAGLNPRPINYDGVPRVTYSEPEVASVGLSTKVAKERGHDVVELDYNLAGNGKAQILKTAGSIKLVAQKNGPILGIHMVGARVGELLAEAQLIFNWEATADDVAPLLHAHPTMSEAMGEAHMALAGKPLHSHG